MRNLEDLCESLLDTGFGNDDEPLTSGLEEFFPDAKLSVIGKTLVAKYASKNYYDIIFDDSIRDRGFSKLKIDAPNNTYINIFFLSHDKYLTDFAIDAPGVKLKMDGIPQVFDNVGINAAGVQFIKLKEYNWHKVRIDVGEDGKILLELPYGARHTMDTTCKFNCGLLGIAPLNTRDIIHKKLVKLGYSDVTLNRLLEPEEYLEKPLLKSLGINPKSWPNLKNIIIAMTDGRVANYGLEFFNRHRAATAWGRWKDDIAEFADGWEGSASSNFHMAFYL